MNVLFLTLSNMENIYDRGIYSDLVRELAKRGINIHVVFHENGERCYLLS